MDECKQGNHTVEKVIPEEKMDQNYKYSCPCGFLVIWQNPEMQTITVE